MKFQSTDAIFSTIGNYPVVDQFDVLYSNLQAGTTYDNYVTGAMLQEVDNLVESAFEPGVRGLAFNKLSVSQTETPAASTDDKQSYEIQPWRERAGNIRNARIFSNSERYYDSLIPDLKLMTNVCGGKLFKSIFNQVTFTIGIDNTWNATAGFENSFPFEPIYSNIERQTFLSNGFVAEVDVSGSSLTTPFTSNTLSIRDLTRFVPAAITDFKHGSFWTRYINPSSTAGTGSGVFSEDASKILFGFGDGRTQSPFVSSSITQPPRRYLPMWRRQHSAGYTSLVSPIIRGWKYGLHDGQPHYTSVVFRRDRFGQFRDMLEQRTIPATYVDAYNAPLRLEGSFEKRVLPPGVQDIGDDAPKQGTVVYPLVVDFVQQTIIDGKENYIKNAPTNTWSSNLDMHATSSLPFFDGQSRNRGVLSTPSNNLIVASFVEASSIPTITMS